MATDAERERNYEYRKTKCKQINVVLYPGDEDVKEKLESVPKKATYIKKLIRDDIERGES